MITDFDIGDKVILKGTIEKITINKLYGVLYTVRINSELGEEIIVSKPHIRKDNESKETIYEEIKPIDDRVLSTELGRL